MKKLIVVLFAILVASVSMNAQVAKEGSGFVFHGGKYYQNGVLVAPEQLASVLGQLTYDNQYKPAKGLRTAGIVCLSTGGAATVIGTGLIIGGVVSGNSQSGSVAAGTVMVGTGTITAACGAAVAITGGILLGSGNKRLKNIRPAANGTGISVMF